jgi:hypothetical protein
MKLADGKVSDGTAFYASIRAVATGKGTPGSA